MSFSDSSSEPGAVLSSPIPPSQPPSQPSSQPPSRSRKHSRWRLLIWITLLAALLIFVAVVIGNRYASTKAILSPGVTLDIEDRIEVSGGDTYPSPGEIRLVTVRADYSPTIFEVAPGWLDSSINIVDRSDILGDRTVEENREVGRTSLTNSGDVAVRVALAHLGYEVAESSGVLIQEVQADSPAEGALAAEDVVVAIQGERVRTVTELVDAIAAAGPGTEVELSVLRGAQRPADPDTAQTESVVVTLAEREGRAFLGVVITPLVQLLDLPFDIDLDFGAIGGPSAGLAICLSVIDLLTENELTAGLDVVATGTIGVDGAVGNIGGLEQKAHAVLREGADLFLVPASQVAEAEIVLFGFVEVAGVETLQDAIDAIATATAGRSGA